MVFGAIQCDGCRLGRRNIFGGNLLSVPINVDVETVLGNVVRKVAFISAVVIVANDLVPRLIVNVFELDDKSNDLPSNCVESETTTNSMIDGNRKLSVVFPRPSSSSTHLEHPFPIDPIERLYFAIVFNVLTDTVSPK